MGDHKPEQGQVCGSCVSFGEYIFRISREFCRGGLNIQKIPISSTLVNGSWCSDNAINFSSASRMSSSCFSSVQNSCVWKTFTIAWYFWCPPSLFIPYSFGLSVNACPKAFAASKSTDDKHVCCKISSLNRILKRLQVQEGCLLYCNTQIGLKWEFC